MEDAARTTVRKGHRRVAAATWDEHDAVGHRGRDAPPEHPEPDFQIESSRPARQERWPLLAEVAMTKHLYDVTRDICHEFGLSWTDPRTGITYPPETVMKEKKAPDVHAGNYYGVRHGGGPLEPAPPGVPDIVVCRRVGDYPGGQPPAQAALETCTRCSALIAYNPQGPFQYVPKICMQCARI